MIRALLWKEYREHRMVWLAMLAVTATVLYTLGRLLTGQVTQNETIHNVTGGVVFWVALAYGVVCGSMMLAGEREGNTLAFLDALPSWRTRVWTIKFVAGSVLTLTQTLALLTIVIAITIQRGERWYPEVLWFFAVVGWSGFTWGLFGSALCRSVLAAAALSAVLPGLVGFTAMSLVFLFLAKFLGMLLYPGGELLNNRFILYVFGATALVSLAGSRWFFCRPDRERRATGVRSPRSAFWRLGPLAGWPQLVWLSVRQGWVAALVMAGISFLLGLFLPAYGFVLWPGLTFVVGVLCGTAVFAPEQSGTWYQFLANQRLPLGRVWLMKTASWLATGAASGALILLGGLAGLALRTPDVFMNVNLSWRDVWERTFGQTFDMWGIEIKVLLTVWLVYGFALGQLVSLLARKIVVGVVIAVFIGLLILGLWLPSLIFGGLKNWQIYAIPLLFLAASRLVMWPWAGERLRAWKPASGLLACAVLAAGWLAANLWYRVAEVPDLGEPFDVKAYEASLPPPEKNEAGQLIQVAVGEADEREKIVSEKLVPLKNPPVLEGQPAGERMDRSEQLNQVLEHGWRAADDADFGPWLDALCQDDWVKHIRQAAALPVGVFEDPRYALQSSRAVDTCWRMGAFLAARALQIQAHGDSAKALDHLLWALALSRNLRHRALTHSYYFGQGVEDMALHGLDHWLNHLGPKPKLLARALEALNRHEAQTPPPSERVKAKYINVRENMGDYWRRYIDDFYSSLHQRPSKLQEALFIFHGALFILAAEAPWEKARSLRDINLECAADLQLAAADFWQMAILGIDKVRALPGAPRWWKYHGDYTKFLFFSTEGWERRSDETLSICRVRAARLKLALALYQATEHKRAQTLDQLVPRYLAQLPLDPFNGKPFHYRISKGERIRTETEDTKDLKAFQFVPRGQAILWSVGFDLIDNGGTKQGDGIPAWAWKYQHPGYDLIFFGAEWGKE